MPSVTKYAYVIVQRDYDHHSDEAHEQVTVHSVYFDLALANSHAQQLAFEAAGLEDGEDWKSDTVSGIDPNEYKNNHGGYGCNCQTFEDHRDHFTMEVERHTFYGDEENQDDATTASFSEVEVVDEPTPEEVAAKRAAKRKRKQ